MNGRDVLRLGILKKDLFLVWSAETSSDPDGWRNMNPSWGQCAVTALVVQDAFGGELLRVVATLPDGSEISHYYNKLPSGEFVDLTRSQFPGDTEFSEPVVRERDYVLSYPATVVRYELLKERLKDFYC